MDVLNVKTKTKFGFKVDEKVKQKTCRVTIIMKT